MIFRSCIRIANFPLKRSLTRACSTRSNGNPKDSDHIRHKIVMASILHIGQDGFSQTAISRACEDLGLSSASARLLDNGPIAMINYLNESWNNDFKLDMEQIIKPE